MNKATTLVHERLNRCADLLEEYGRAKGSLGKRGEPMCIIGALAQVLEDEGLEEEDALAVGEVCIREMHARLPKCTRPIFRWNDADATDKQAISMLRGVTASVV